VTTWTKRDERRIRELREKRDLTDSERDELRALRRREIVEAFNRRRDWLKKKGGA